MEKRKLGSTGFSISLLGLGGFHLVELPEKEALRIVNLYLDQGGNYLETAESYGSGNSEEKIGKVAKVRRNDFILATKSAQRSKEGITRALEGSLRRLNTSEVDIFFIHGLNRFEELDEISSSQGALEGVEKAKKEGKIRFVAFSNHVTPEVALNALSLYPFDILMIPLNYFDRFNFPGWEEEVLPWAQEKRMGILAMKALADGFLWESEREAIRYTLSLGVDSLVMGANTEEYLRRDIEVVENFVPFTPEEMKKVREEAPELGSYVCRQCDKCLPCPLGIDIPGVFLLEGQYDRQMQDGIIRDPAQYALRDRLRFWLGNQDYAQKAYQELNPKASVCNECGECEPRCPYKIPIIYKLNLAHEKLTDTRPPGYCRIS
ncbi:MAG: aldo/keto reductase [Atribacterales bacterium]